MNLSRRAAFVTPLLCLALLPLVMPSTSLAADTNGSGKLATETRSVAEFQAVSLNGPMDLVVRQGAQQSVQVQGDDNLLPQLETVVEGKSTGATLVVRWKKDGGHGWRWSSRNKVVVTVVVPRLTAVSAASSGDIRVETFETPALQLAIAGSGNARFENLSTQELGVRISGSGDVGGKGNAARLKVNIAGSGDVALTELRSEDVSVSIAGSGGAAVNAQKTLNVSIAGSGDVIYTGNATVKSSVAGSGSVTRK